MFSMATGFNASYVSAADSGPGVLLFLRDRSLYAQRFDDKTAELRGNAVKLAVRLGPLCGSLREFCTHCDPHSGPRRAERAQETLCQPAERLRGDIKGRSPLAG